MPGARSSIAGRLRQLAALVALATLSGASVDAAGDSVTTSHGFAVFGELKYGPEFEHFDYVNPQAPKGGTYRYAQTSTFDSLNITSLLTVAPQVLTFLADSLLKQSRDEPASFYCLICETISWPEDLAWAEFKLRPEARFGDGTPITVEDVVYGLEIARGVSVPAFKRVADTIERTERTGPRSVRFYFKLKGNRTNPTIIGFMPIVPKHYYGRLDMTKPLLEPPPANGPYRVSRFDQGHFVELTRVEDYWAKDLPISKGRYNFDVLRHDFYRDSSLLDEAFATGLVDLRMETNTANLRQLFRLPAYRSGDIQRIELPYENGAIYNSLTFNARRPFLSDREVRKALVLAYDYEFVKRTVLGGDYGRLTSNFPNTEFAATGLPSAGELAILEPHRAELPPELFTEAPSLPRGGSWAKMRRNLLEARAVLAARGYHVSDGMLIDPVTGRPVVLRLLAYSPLVYEMVAPFIDALRRLGIGVAFRNVDAAQLRVLMRNHEFDLLMYLNVFAPLNTPGPGIGLIYGSASTNTPNSLNYSGVDDPAVDDALVAMLTAPDRPRVVDAMRAIDRVTLWQYYSVPLNHSYPTPVGKLPVSYWNKFGRPAVEQTWNFPYHSAETWWYEPAKAASLSHGIYAR